MIDLASDAAVQDMAELAIGKPVGLLILNAGADSNGAMFLDNEIAAWDALAMRNVMCVMRACHHFASPMRERGRGGIIIVGSGAGYGGLPGIAIYSATKAFDLVLGEALWAELRDHGVDVLSYMIGRTDTPAHRELMEARGMAIPDDMANADDVAQVGLERLQHGPVHNWGQADDEAGVSGASAASRRARIVAIAAVSARYAGKGDVRGSR